MNEKIINLYKRKIAIANITFFIIVTLIYFISNRLNNKEVNIIFLFIFLFIFIASNIAKVDGPIYMIFPSMRELSKLESLPWKKEVNIKSKSSLLFILIYLSKLFDKNHAGFFIDLKVYLILLIVMLIIINFDLREEYKSIFNYNKNKGHKKIP